MAEFTDTQISDFLNLLLFFPDKESRLKMDLKDRKKVCELDSSGSGEEPVAGCCEHGGEISDCIKCKQFLE
jgi:hypothetical protein